jgi:D-amino peptidase
MKIFISADMEGVAGCTARTEVDPANSSEYPVFCRRMTAEVRAACEGAFAAGAEEVWIKDAHWTGRNINAAELPDKGVRLIRGWSGHPYSMMQELSRDFAAAVFIGYHSRAGSGGNPLAHTLSSRTFAEIRLNGQPVSEFHLNSFTAHLEGVPVTFLSGDRALCEEALAFNEQLVTVATMQGIGDSTISLHPDSAIAQIRGGVERSLRRELERLPKPLPENFALEVCYRSPAQAYRASFYPGASVLSENTLRFETAHYLDVLRFLQFAI